MNYKTLLVLFLLGATSVSQSQNIIIKGVIKDIVSQLPVSSTTITTRNSNFGTISNEEGVFELNIPKSNDTIVFSHLGYKPYKVALSSIKATDVDFYMESQTEELEEVIVMKDGYENLIKRLIASSKARLIQPVLMHTYFREFVKVNEQYTKFSDGQLDYLMTRKRKDFDSELNVKQVRAVFLPAEKDEEEIDFNNMSRIYRTPGIMENFDVLDRVLLSKNNYDDYEFILKSKKTAAGEEMLTLHFNPKDGIEEGLYKGSITFNPKTSAISNMTVYLDPDFKKYLKEINAIIIKVTLIEYKVEVNFKWVNDNYMLSNYFMDFKFKMRNKNRYNHVLEFKSDLVVTDFTKDISSFNKKALYKERSLYVYGNKHTYQFWKNNNAIVLTNEEEEIIKKLENTK